MESDITVIIEGNGIKNGDYKDFFVFIVSPQKYYELDS